MKADTETMSDTLTIRIKEDERAELQKMALSVGIPASNLTRRLINEATSKFKRDGFLKIEAQPTEPTPQKP